MNRTLLFLATLGAALLAGCGHEESAGPAATPPAVPPVAGPGPSTADPNRLSQADLDAIARSAKPYKLALIVKTRNNPFFEPMIRAATDEAKALGVELDVQAPQQETDAEQQFALVQNVTARGVQAILVTPAESKGIVPALKQAQ